jgi:hypothetical protein
VDERGGALGVQFGEGMKAKVRIAAIILFCPDCQRILPSPDGAATWLREHLADRFKRTITCSYCATTSDLPHVFEVFRAIDPDELPLP